MAPAKQRGVRKPWRISGPPHNDGKSQTGISGVLPAVGCPLSRQELAELNLEQLARAITLRSQDPDCRDQKAVRSRFVERATVLDAVPCGRSSVVPASVAV